MQNITLHYMSETEGLSGSGNSIRYIDKINATDPNEVDRLERLNHLSVKQLCSVIKDLTIGSEVQMEGLKIDNLSEYMRFRSSDMTRSERTDILFSIAEISIEFSQRDTVPAASAVGLLSIQQSVLRAEIAEQRRQR
jgi:hypothetical protein